VRIEMNFYIAKETMKCYLDYIFPRLYIRLIKLKYVLNKERDRTVCSDTDLCLEGYPRSANSFMSAFFNKYTKLNLSDHTHYSSNVLLAINKGKRVIVLIRKPEDAIVSNVSLYLQSQVRDFNRKLKDFDDAFISSLILLSIKRYKFFYSSIRESEILFLSFEQVTSDIEKTIKMINYYHSLSIVIPKGADAVAKDVLSGGGVSFSSI